MNCTRCAATLPADAQFCSSCGTPVAVTFDERRIVTVMFADLTGFTSLSERLDPEQVKRIVDRVFAVLGLVVERYGGRIDKVIGDELMAVFGAPEAHEDDPERAVRCAFAMRAELERMRNEPTMPALTMHVGINTGEVVAGRLGGREYTILGDAVNVARRITDAAGDGQIVAGQATVALTEHAVSYRPLTAIAAKGKDQPLQAAEALAERGLPGRTAELETPLIGRREELHLVALAGLLAERDTRPYVVTVVGEAGMGKSKLASEIVAGARQRGLRVLSGRSLPYATVSLGFALEQLVRGALELDESSVYLPQLQNKLSELGLQGDVDTLAAFLGIDRDPGSTATGGAPGAGAVPTPRRVIDACVRLLSQVAKQQRLLVCVLNDLQWAEEIVTQTLDALILQDNAPILIVALARPGLLESPPGYLDAPGSFVLPLGALSKERAAEVVSAIAPDVPIGVRDEIVARAGGNPFFLEELARLAARSKEPGTIPATVQALVTARIDSLEPHLRRLLQVASVPVNAVTIQMLEALGAEPPVSQSVDELCANGFFEPDAQAVRFRQKLVREVAYASMPKQKRVEAHEKLGQYLLEHRPDRIDEIAHTFERAAILASELGLPQSPSAKAARESLIELANKALANDSVATARMLFERALVILDEPLPISARIGYGAALVGVLDLTAGDTELAGALEDARAHGDRRNEGRALRLIGDSLRMRGRSDEAREALDAAIEIARTIAEPVDLIEAERARGLLDLFTGDYREASETFRQALEQAREAGDARAQGWALQNLGWTMMIRGHQEDAIDAFIAGEKIFEELDDAEGRGWCMGMRAWALLMLERVDECVDLMEQVERIVVQDYPGDEAHLVMARRVVHVLRAYVAVTRGDLLAAEAMSRRVLEEPDWHNQNWAHALAAYPLALSALLQARPDTAEQAIAHGLEAARAGGDPFYVALYRVAAAWLSLLRGDLAGCDAELDALSENVEAGRSWQRSSIVSWLRARAKGDRESLLQGADELHQPGRREGITVLPVSYLLADLAETLLPLDPQAAKEMAADARRSIAGSMIGRIQALLASARIEIASGARNEALDTINEAIDLVDAAGWPIATARAHALLAEILDARREHDRADVVFERAKDLLAVLPEDTLPSARRLARA
jgi:class 3 adenylate cyclase/tetratricopeptide (TPR) repeat protein